jgi:hypothetical protein
MPEYGPMNAETLMRADLYWKTILYERDSYGKVIYIGYHTEFEAAYKSDDWWVLRVDYDSSGMILRRLKRGSWKSRTAGWTKDYYATG